LDNPITSVSRFDSNFVGVGYYIFSFYGGRPDLKEKLSERYHLVKSESILKENNNRNWGVSLFKLNN
jgi:hypothetical protein